MKYYSQLSVWLFAAFISFSAHADVLVLVHGYMGSADSWESSGVNGVLDSNGWHRAGILAGPRLTPGPGARAVNKTYVVELPSLAPMMVQADHLQAMLRQVSTLNPGQPMIIAAHSAGGVVARIALVRGAVPNAKALITIATPHLGTGRAIQALEATSSSWPVGVVKNLFSNGLYRTVKNSRGALIDLTPAQPGSLLFWLNRQPHPEIAYYTILRTGPVGLGDELVPVFSQDMNNVPALKGRSQVLALASGHSLNREDGRALVDILSGNH